MKSKIALLHSNNLLESKRLAKQVCSNMQINVYCVEDRAYQLINEEGALKDFIIQELGEKAYKNGFFDTSLTNSFDFNNSAFLNKLQEIMYDYIVKEIESLDKLTLIISNQIIETGILHLSNNLIICEFKNSEETEESINLESLKTVASHYIQTDNFKNMSISLTGCLVYCFNH